MYGRRFSKHAKHMDMGQSRNHSWSNISNNLCAICAHKPRSPELGGSCPPFHEYAVILLSSKSPSVRVTKCAIGSRLPRTKSVGMWINCIPEREASSLLRPPASNGGKGERRMRHLTLYGRWRSVERAAAAPSECAKITSGLFVLIEEAMRSIPATTDDGESPSQNE